MFNQSQFFLSSQCRPAGIHNDFGLPAYTFDSLSFTVEIVTLEKLNLVRRVYKESGHTTGWMICSSFQHLLYVCNESADPQQFEGFVDGAHVLSHIDLTKREVSFLLDHGFHDQLAEHPLLELVVRERHAQSSFKFILREVQIESLTVRQQQQMLEMYVDNASAEDKQSSQFSQAREKGAQITAQLTRTQELLELSRLHSPTWLHNNLTAPEWVTLCETLNWKLDCYRPKMPGTIAPQKHILDCGAAQSTDALVKRLRKEYPTINGSKLRSLAEWLMKRKIKIDLTITLKKQVWYTMAAKLLSL